MNTTTRDIIVLQSRGATEKKHKRQIRVHEENNKCFIKMSDLKLGFPGAIGLEFLSSDEIWSPRSPDSVDGGQEVIFLPDDNPSEYVVILPDKQCVDSVDPMTEFSAELDSWSNISDKSELCQQIKSIVERAYVPGSSLYKLIESNTMPGELYKNKLLPANIELLATKHPPDETASPNLLLHDLHITSESKLKKVDTIINSIEKSKLGIIIGPSGSGKTRTILEFLSVKFGIFLLGTTQYNGGSGDVEFLIRDCEISHSVVRSMRLARGLESIIAIRIAFMRTMRQVIGTKFSPFHWLVVQELPTQLFGLDVFKQLSLSFKMRLETVRNIQGFSDELARLPVFLDEAQVLPRMKECCSASHLNDVFNSNEMSLQQKFKCSLERSATSPVLYLATAAEKVIFVLSGTGFALKEINECLQSRHVKIFIESPDYITPGRFATFNRFAAYVNQFLPSLSEADLKLAFSYLKGRYRYSAYFVAHYLRTQGEKSVKQVLEDVFKSAKKDIVVTLSNNELGQISQYVANNKQVQEMLYNFFWHRKYKAVHTANIDLVKLIEYGLALISPLAEEVDDTVQLYLSTAQFCPNVRIVEPIIFEILHRELSPSTSEVKDIYYALALDQLDNGGSKNPSVKGFICEELISMQLVRAIEKGKIEVFKGMRVLDRKFGCSFCISCDTALNKELICSYSFSDYIQQPFDQGTEDFVSIMPEQKSSIPDYVLVFQDEKTKQLGIGLVQIKNRKKNQYDDCKTLNLEAYSSEFIEHLAKFSLPIKKILIQSGNDSPYTSMVDEDVTVLTLDDLGFSKQDQEILMLSEDSKRVLNHDMDQEISPKKAKGTINFKCTDPTRKSTRNK